MTQPATAPRRVADVVEHAKVYPHARIAAEMYVSYPIPVRAKEGVDLAFLYGAQNANPQMGLWYAPPIRMALVDAASGALRDVRTVSPADFGQVMPPHGTLGKMPGATVEDASARPRREQDLYDAYDRVLPAFAANRTQLNDAEREGARRARAEFAHLVEPPLRPYYDVIGRDFFAWLAAAK